MITQVKKIIEAALNDDKQRVSSYAKVISENLIKEGKHREARMIMRAIEPENPLYHSDPVSLDNQIK